MRQLIKHEFKNSFKFSIIGLAICLAGYLLYSIYMFIIVHIGRGNMYINIITGTFTLILIASIATPVIFFFINCKKTCIDKIFYDEGYLTMSLPVSTHELILSKIIVLIIWGLVYVVANYIGSLLLTLVMIGDVNSTFEFIKNAIQSTFFSGIESVMKIYDLLIDVIKVVLIIFLVGSLTNLFRARQNKVVIGIAMAFVIVSCISTLNTVAQILPFGVLRTMKGYQFHFGITYDGSYVVNITSIIINIGLLIAMYFINYKIIDKDLELI